MNELAAHVFTKSVTKEGLLYAATSTKPCSKSKRKLRAIKRRAERRYPKEK